MNSASTTIVSDPRPAPLSESHAPVLTVVVDTEEEFDWQAGFDSRATSVAAMDKIHVFQKLCDSFGIQPAYIVDYPVAIQERGFRPLLDFHRSGRAEIGAHLHPWVTPPFDEDLLPENSYPGNLPSGLEKAKLRSLLEAIEASFGVRPRLYKAGRYGIGPNTPRILVELGFEIDASLCPAFDFSADGGPDFSSSPVEPFWFGDDQRLLLELPNTGAFVGFLGNLSSQVFRLANRPFLRPLRVPGILSRVRAVDRLLLSPEGFRLEEIKRLTLALLRAGVRTFAFSLHSPSLKLGCTPYVQSVSDLESLLDRCRRYFRFLRRKNFMESP